MKSGGASPDPVREEHRKDWPALRASEAKRFSHIGPRADALSIGRHIRTRVGQRYHIRPVPQLQVRAQGGLPHRKAPRARDKRHRSRVPQQDEGKVQYGVRGQVCAITPPSSLQDGRRDRVHILWLGLEIQRLGPVLRRSHRNAVAFPYLGAHHGESVQSHLPSFAFCLSQLYHG